MNLKKMEKEQVFFVLCFLLSLFLLVSFVSRSENGNIEFPPSNKKTLEKKQKREEQKSSNPRK